MLPVFQENYPESFWSSSAAVSQLHGAGFLVPEDEDNIHF